MIVAVVSDLHLGRGKFLRNGQHNILEDFDHDHSFDEFVDYFSDPQFEGQEIQLVLNGDIFNLIQIDLDGVFLPSITENIALRSLHKIIEGHEVFFNALRKFNSNTKRSIVYVIGNHDSPMYWNKLQEAFTQQVGGDVEFCFSKNINGIHIEHGHRFEVINAVPLKDYFTTGPTGEEVLNLPWGSLFCVTILPSLKKRRPYIDRVRPTGLYIRWSLIYDFSFFLLMSFTVMRFVFQTLFQRYQEKKRDGLLSMIKLLKQITVYPKYERQAKNIFRKNRDIHTVIMGHSHLREWRRFPEDKFYFNTGTWTFIPSMNTAMHQNELVLNYVMIEVDQGSNLVIKRSMNAWLGKWRPYRSDIVINN